MYSKTKPNLSTTTIQSLVSRAFGKGVSALRIMELNDGWFNAAYRLELDNHINTVLKVAPAPECPVLTYEKQCMAIEVHTIQWLKGKGIPVPQVYYTDFSQMYMANNYYFMQFFNGLTLNVAIQQMNDNQKEHILWEFGAVMGKINSLKGVGFGPIIDQTSKSWHSAFFTMVEDILADADRFNVLLPVAPQKLLATLLQSSRVLAHVSKPSLVHWDSWEGNVIIDYREDVPYIRGIIDWERSFFGDPLSEHVFVTKKSKSFYAGYGKNLLGHTDAFLRRQLYTVYLNLVMLVECASRQYSDAEISEQCYKNLSSDLIHLEKYL